MLTDDFQSFARDPANADAVAETIAKILPRYLSGAAYRKYFPFWERHGFHIMPNHFYHPIPDTQSLGQQPWDKESDLPGIDLRVEAQLELAGDVSPLPAVLGRGELLDQKESLG